MTAQAETVRNTYRRQGAEALTEQVIRNITLDAVISTNVDVRFLERLVQIIEASRDEVIAR
jgi:hypothetical protein